MQTERDEILKILQKFKEKYRQKGIVKLGLFGSFSKGTANPYSDIDIAFAKIPDYLDHFGPYDYFETLEELRKELLEALHRPIDLFDLDSQSPLKNEIERELIDA